MINEITKVGTVLSKVAGRSGLLASKYAPEILLGLGIASVVGGTILACKATLKVEDILDEHTARMNEVDKIEDEEEHKKETVKVYANTTASLVREYAPAVVCIGAGVGMLTGSHHILKMRNTALIAAYNALDKSYTMYRKNVVDQLGEEADTKFRFNATEETITEQVEEDGKKKNKKRKVIKAPTDDAPSQYARFFDDASPLWQHTPEYNLVFLRAQQNYANDLLRVRGHVFLNEVYDMLGIPRSQAGAVVGWVKGNGDNFIDFGIYDSLDMMKREFVNGVEGAILLDFNVDGIIYDLI